MKSQIKISSVLLTASLLALAACSQDDGNKSSKNEPFSLKTALREGQDVSSESNFKSLGKYEDLLKNGEEKSSERQSIGCGAGNYKMDPAVKVGTKFFTRYKSFGTVGYVEQISSETLQSFVSDKTEVLKEFISISVSDLGGEILKDKIKYTETCQEKVETNEGSTISSMQCSSNSPSDISEYYKPGVQDYMRTHHLQMNTSCRIQSNSSVDNSVEVGTYALQSGETVKAYKETNISKGDVICKYGEIEENMGPGEEVSYQIKSNQVLPGTSTYYCGGATLVSGSVLRLGEQIIESYQYERFLTEKRK